MRKGWFYKSFSPLRMFYFSYLRARILAKRPWERPNCFGKKCLWIKLEGINLTYKLAPKRTIYCAKGNV